jgi:hypothetical protein
MSQSKLLEPTVDFLSDIALLGHQKCSAAMLSALVQGFSAYRVGANGEEVIAVMFMVKSTSSTDHLTHLKELELYFEKDTYSRLSAIHGLGIANPCYYTAEVSLPTLDWLIRSPWITEIELTAQLKPSRDIPLSPERSVDRLSAAADIPTSDAETIIGVIDFGFPFAHNEYLDKGEKTRIHAIWDQDHTPEFKSDKGSIPNGFSYGRQVDRSAIQGFIDGGLVDGIFNEDKVYRDAACPSMRARITHGSSSIAILAANRLTSSCPANLVNEGSSNSQKTDIVLVQVPYALPLAPCSGAAENCILDGLRYMLACAGKATKRIVASIGYGSYLGPHDGSTIFESAIANLVASATKSNVKLDVVFASGNGYNKSIHARSADSSFNTQVIGWWVPPGNSVPTFSDAWLSLTDSETFICSLISPVGKAIEAKIAPGKLSAISSDPNIGNATIVLQRKNGKLHVLIEVPPEGYAGRWRIEFNAPESNRRIDINTAWGGRNPSFYRRALQGKFLPVVLSDEQKKTKTSMEIDGNGSLISSACNSSVWLVGGYEMWGNKLRTKYSGGGFSHGGARANRASTGVDILAPCEQSPQLQLHSRKWNQFRCAIICSCVIE